MSAQTAVVTEPTAPGEHRRARDLRLAGRRDDAHAPRTARGAARDDHLHVPVGALRRGRRTARRLELPVDPRGDELELHADGGRHRAAAPRPGNGDERAGSTTATSNPTDTVTQSTSTGPPRNTAEPSISGTPDAWDGCSPAASAPGRVRRSRSRSSGCAAAATAGSRTARTARPSPAPRRRATSLRATTSDNGFASASPPRTASAPRPSRRTRRPRSRRRRPPPRHRRRRATRSCRRSSAPPRVGATLTATTGVWTGAAPLLYSFAWQGCDAAGGSCTPIAGATGTQYVATAADLGRRLRVQVTARNTLGTATATSNATAQVQAAGSGGTPTTPTTPRPPTNLPSGAIRLPSGTYSIPVTSVSPPERLVAGAFAFTPETVRSRERPIVLRVRVVDTRGYAVRDALVFVRSTPLVTSSPGEVRTGRDGWARVRMTPQAEFPAQRQERPVLRQGAQGVGPAARRSLEPAARAGGDGRRRRLVVGGGRVGLAGAATSPARKASGAEPPHVVIRGSRR